MRVIVNGEPREIASRSVDALLGELEYEGTHFAIAVNYDVLPKSRWAETSLKSGDEIEITAIVTDGILQDLKFQGHGCAISQSSASMMTEALKGKAVKEALVIASRFKGLLLPGGPADAKPLDLGDLETLEGVKKYPVRVKCATLAWNTLSDALKDLK